MQFISEQLRIYFALFTIPNPNHPSLHSVHYFTPHLSSFARYADRNLPVLISGAMADWTANTVWQRDAFVAKYGEMPVRVRRSLDIA
jgi:hypothetical protein